MGSSSLLSSAFMDYYNQHTPGSNDGCDDDSTPYTDHGTDSVVMMYHDECDSCNVVMMMGTA